jgi:hypothetical protein
MAGDGGMVSKKISGKRSVTKYEVLAALQLQLHL